MQFVNIFKHFHRINKHRFWVFIYCIRAGIPIRGLKHDLSKYSFTEFWESVKYYKKEESPIIMCKKINGVSYAWLHHKAHNKHHYEYWQDNFDKGVTHLVMPYKDSLEMLCDYLAAGRIYNKKNKEELIKNEIEYWNEKKKTAAMNEVNKEFITKSLNLMNNCKYKDIWKINFKTIYKECIKKAKNI